MRSFTHLLRKGARLALPLFLFSLLSFQPTWASPLIQDQGPNRAGLVVVHGDGRTVTRCVSFAEPELTGFGLLQRSGLGVLTESGPMGSTICSIDGEGCPSLDCWCECKGTPCAYWNYFYRSAAGAWNYSGAGAAMRTLRNGDVDGWVWGDGSQVPPAVSFEAICDGAVAAENPTPTPAPEAGPTLSPSMTPSPFATATATSTPPPTETSVPDRSETTVAPMQTATTMPTETPHATESPEPTATATSAATTVATSAATTVATTAPEPALTSTPAEPTSESESGGGVPGEYLAFLALIGIVGIVFFLLRGRRRA